MTSAATMAPYNYSFSSIAAMYCLAFVPHMFYAARLTIATKGQMSTALPRTNLEAWKGKLAPAVWDTLARARGAHTNSLEVLPLFAAAMLAGNVAQLPTSDLNSMAGQFLGLRVLYMILYMSVPNGILAYARTGVFAWSVSIPVLGLIQAGRAISEV